MFNFKGWSPFPYKKRPSLHRNCKNKMHLFYCHLDFDCLYFICVLFSVELYLYRMVLLRSPCQLEGVWHTNPVPGSLALQILLERLWVSPSVLVSLPKWMLLFQIFPDWAIPLIVTVCYPILLSTVQFTSWYEQIDFHIIIVIIEMNQENYIG